MARRFRASALPILLLPLLSGCVVDDPVGARAEEQVDTGVQRMEGVEYDPVTDTYTVERSLDLDSRSETDEFVESMRNRRRP